MNINANIFDVVILVGTIQGFIVSALLYFNREKIYANKFLATLILLISLACLNIYLLETGVQQSSTLLSIISLVIPLVVVMPAGPLIYFYVQSLISSDFAVKRQQRIHFYPVILDLVPSLTATIYISGVFLKWIDTNEQFQWGLFIDSYNMYVDIPRWISVSTYTLIAWKKVNEFQKEEPGSKVSVWPKQFINTFIVFQVIWLVHLIPYIIPSLSQVLLENVSWYPIYIPLAILVYWLGIKGYLIRKPAKTGSTNPSKDTIDQAISILNKSMLHDRLFLNPSLNLNYMVKHTGIPQKIISAALNQHLGKSFNEFVNEYRVEEVKKRLIEPGHEHLTITGIAFESGFNSQATFQRTFKQFTNQSPREFRLTNQTKNLSQ